LGRQPAVQYLSRLGDVVQALERVLTPEAEAFYPIESPPCRIDKALLYR
jgi:hypothetical protein